LAIARQSIHGSWRSQWTFILAATSATIGLGNLWKFAYLAGEHGGSGFILMYLVFVILIATPVLAAEVVLGTRGRSDPIHAVEAALLESALSRNWRGLGWLSCIAGLLILSYLSVIGGWIIAYCRWLYQGDLAATSARQVGELFGQLLGDGSRQAALHALFMFCVWIVVALGVTRGLGRVLSMIAPLLLLLLIVLVLSAIRMGDVAAAVQFMFALRTENLHADGVLAALGQAFFSLGIGMGAMISFGGYAPERRSITHMLGAVVALHIAIALLAGLAIFPLVFAHRVQPAFGPGLMFVTLPYIFGNLPYGAVLGTVFFTMVLLAALGSAIALLEPTTAWLVQRFRWRRPFAALGLAALVWLLGLPNVFSFSLWPQWRPGGKSVFAWIDWLSADVMLPVVALAVAVLVGWRMRPEAIHDELLAAHPRLFTLWRLLLRYIAPLAIGTILLTGIYGVWTQQ
jgi:neurotransmitter:Na+ symporter, NSS family